MDRERVLVIEDEEAVARALMVRLEAWGYDALWVDRAPEGIDLIAEQRPACVLLDLRMPGMDGFEALGEIAERFGDDAPPVLVVSAELQDESRERATRLGATAFLRKPLEPGRLLNEMRLATGRHATDSMGGTE